MKCWLSQLNVALLLLCYLHVMGLVRFLHLIIRNLSHLTSPLRINILVHIGPLHQFEVKVSCHHCLARVAVETQVVIDLSCLVSAYQSVLTTIHTLSKFEQNELYSAGLSSMDC